MLSIRNPRPESSAMATLIKRAESVDEQRCAAAVQRTAGAAQDLHGQVVETVTCCIQVPVSDSLAVTLETLEPLARICVDRMLVHRERSSSAFYPELPCVIAKSLIAKYQRNKKCKVVTNLVLPLCGGKADGPNLSTCWMQKDPARQLSDDDSPSQS